MKIRVGPQDNARRPLGFAHFVHGHTAGGKYHPLYCIHTTMLQRCFNKKHPKYPLYGGRGITVCRRWLEFKNFLADMGARPTPGHQIERIDNNGDYEPSNCKWATRKEQGNNRRDNHVLSFNGRSATLMQWSETTGLPYCTLKVRINVLKWSIRKALTHPLKKIKKPQRSNFTGDQIRAIRGSGLRICDIAKNFGVSVGTIDHIRKRRTFKYVT